MYHSCIPAIERVLAVMYFAGGAFHVRGPPLDICGEAWRFCLTIFFFTREIEGFFSRQDRVEIFISIFILYLFQPPVWIK